MKHLYSAKLIREESKTTYCSAHVFVQLGTAIAPVQDAQIPHRYPRFDEVDDFILDRVHALCAS